MLPRFAILIVTITCLSSMNLHAQYDAFVSINGIKSIDQPLETVILTENLATVDVILRDSGGGLLADAFANGGGGVQSANVAVNISGGSSSGFEFSIDKPGVTVGTFFFGDESSPQNPDPAATSGLIRGGTGNLFSINGNPSVNVAPGVFEALLGTFQLNFDLASTATIALAQGQSDLINNPSGFFNGVNRDGLTSGSVLESLDDPVALINFHSATIMSTPVPEPSSLAMVGLATVGLIRRRRRQTRRQIAAPAKGL